MKLSGFVIVQLKAANIAYCDLITPYLVNRSIEDLVHSKLTRRVKPQIKDYVKLHLGINYV